MINSLVGGGAERQAAYLADFPFVDRVFCIEPVIDYEVRHEKITVLTNLKPGPSKAHKVKQMTRTIRGLKANGLGKNTHLICFLQLSVITGVICKLLYGCKLTISIRVSPFAHKKTDRSGFSRWQLSRIFSIADHVVINSYEGAHELERAFPFLVEKIQVIPNAFDLDKIASASQIPNPKFNGLFNEYLFLINAGRLNEQKGQKHLIRIFSELKKSDPTLKLCILGEGELKADLIALCQSLGLKVWVSGNTDPSKVHDVYFPGFQQNPFWFFGKAAIFALTSYYEGLPNALVEALACGTPVISTNCKTGPCEIITGIAQNCPRKITQPQHHKAGILMPVFRNSFHLPAELDQVEQIWVKELKSILADGPVLSEMSASAKSSVQQYNLAHAERLWETFLGSSRK